MFKRNTNFRFPEISDKNEKILDCLRFSKEILYTISMGIA